MHGPSFVIRCLLRKHNTHTATPTKIDAIKNKIKIDAIENKNKTKQKQNTKHKASSSSPPLYYMYTILCDPERPLEKSLTMGLQCSGKSHSHTLYFPLHYTFMQTSYSCLDLVMLYNFPHIHPDTFFAIYSLALVCPLCSVIPPLSALFSFHLSSDSCLPCPHIHTDTQTRQKASLGSLTKARSLCQGKDIQHGEEDE